MVQIREMRKPIAPKVNKHKSSRLSQAVNMFVRSPAILETHKPIYILSHFLFLFRSAEMFLSRRFPESTIENGWYVC